MANDLGDRLRTARALIELDSHSTPREKHMAALLGEVMRAIEQPHLQDSAAMTAIANILLSQRRTTVPKLGKYWTHDKRMHDRGIDGLRAIYPLLNDGLDA